VWRMALDQQRDAFLLASIDDTTTPGSAFHFEMPDGAEFPEGFDPTEFFQHVSHVTEGANDPQQQRQSTIHDLNEYAKRDREACLTMLAEWREAAAPGARRSLDLLYVQHLRQAKRRAEAAQILFDLAMASPDDAGIAAQLAGIDPARAEPLLRRIVSMGGDGDGAAIQALVQTLGRLGRANEALDLIGRTLPADATPEQREAALESGNLALHQIDPDALVQWIGAQPRSYGVADAVIQRYAATGRVDAALDLYSSALRSIETNAEAWALPSLPRQLGEARRAEVERLLDQAARNTRANDEILGDIGDAYAQIGRHQDALRMYERARALDPNDGEWTNSIARMRQILSRQ
jgi:tetratricopeptide (TPR) repeat protein